MIEPEPNPLDTAEFSLDEIHQRLEAGRLQIQAIPEGSQLELRSTLAPEPDRRVQASDRPSGTERRRFQPLTIPTLFPEKGPILLLLVGGFANDRALQRPLPFWEDDDDGGWLLWTALGKAGLLHRKDTEQMALGRGGFWDESSPRTQGLAMTYAGYQHRNEAVEFERVIHPWNVHRLQTLILACQERSMGRLKVVTVGEAARFMTCACVYGLPEIPVLSIAAPSKGWLAHQGEAEETAQHWIEWASNLFAVGKS